MPSPRFTHTFCCAAHRLCSAHTLAVTGPLRWNFRPQCDEVSAAALLNTAEPRVVLRSWKSTRQKLSALSPIPSMPKGRC